MLVQLVYQNPQKPGKAEVIFSSSMDPLYSKNGALKSLQTESYILFTESQADAAEVWFLPEETDADFKEIPSAEAAFPLCRSSMSVRALIGDAEYFAVIGNESSSPYVVLNRLKARISFV